MRLLFALGHLALRSALAATLIAVSVPVVQANWLSKLAREAGQAGTKEAKYGVGSLDRAAVYIKALPSTAKGATLAAHATPEGHWIFVNREGEVFTAGTPDELRRAVPTLLPEAPSDAKLTIYLSEDTVFGERALLKHLPEDAALYVVVGKDSFPVVRRSRAGVDKLFAYVRPNLIIELTEQKLFIEAIAQLERPLSRASIRTLALEPGGPATLSSYPRLEPGTKSAVVDAVDPGKLRDAFGSVRGQTVLVTGRVEDNLLFFRPSSGPKQSLKVLDLIGAAEEADVNLVILNSPAPRQPGGRNWLWQRIEVDGLDAALKRATLGDFLDALGASRGQFSVTVAREGSGRVIIRATPAGETAEPITGVVGDWLSDAASHITGNVITNAVEIHALSEARQRELDRRIIPWIPSDFQIAYLVALVAGLLGWPVARGWWNRIWPSEQREEYGGVTGYRAAQAARLLAFLVFFLPVVGIPAFVVSLILQLVGLAAVPVRLVRRLVGGPAPKAG